MAEEPASLEALSEILTQLSERPYDITLHARNIRLAGALQDELGVEDDKISDELRTALEMLPEFLAAGEGVWLDLIRAKEQQVDLETREGVADLLSLYEKAEGDYLSIAILQKHLEFLIEKHEQYTQDTRPESFGDLFSTEWTRAAITDVVNKGLPDLSRGHVLWELQRDWELQLLENASAEEKPSLVDNLQLFLLNRLRQPQADSDDAFQTYSTFTTNYKSPAEYEPLLISASKIRGQGTKAYSRREQYETELSQFGNSLETFARYAAAERRAKNPDLFVLTGVYERAIAEAAKRRWQGHDGMEEALRAFWVGYCDALRINEAEADVQLRVYHRATRSVPGSGEVWARYIRFLEHNQELAEQLPSIDDTFNQASATKMLDSDPEQIIPVFLARAGYHRRQIEANAENEEALLTLIAILEKGIEMVYSASKTGDGRYRLEKYLAEMYTKAGLLDSAVQVWQNAAKKNKSSYLLWTNYTDFLVKHGAYDEARKVFIDVHTKNLDWPEAIWEAWSSFEHLHGSVDDLESCLDKVEKAQYQVNARRAKEAEKASYEAMQVTMEAQAANVPVAEVPVPNVDEPMEVDVPTNQDRGTKRGAEEDTPEDHHKKAKFEKAAPLKRDRENTTVFVAELPTGVTEEDLQSLFKDCGTVREIKITELPNTSVATVEFMDRDSVPPALTKDKKRLHGQEVAVHLAWKSTLYITNFPEATDDAAIRKLFGQYGTILDVRWPSKKFKSTRRFCYLQFTSPNAAQNALGLHGTELEPGLTLNVYISNPERKKERTDQDANDREVYVAGLSKFTTKADLEKLFSTYGTVKEVRMAEDEKGQSKGFAFVEFEQEKDALAALDANNHELKKRRMAVTLADTRARSKKHTPTGTGFGKKADVRNRSVRIRNLPPSTQEGLLQQTLEKLANVKRVEVLLDQNEALVELENAAEAGKLLLRTEPIVFNGNTLEISEEAPEGAPKRTAAPPPKAGGMFVPRNAASRPRAGLGAARKPNAAAATSSKQTSFVPSSGKGQDDFRKMLGGQ